MLRIPYFKLLLVALLAAYLVAEVQALDVSRAQKIGIFRSRARRGAPAKGDGGGGGAGAGGDPIEKIVNFIVTKVGSNTGPQWEAVLKKHLATLRLIGAADAPTLVWSPPDMGKHAAALLAPVPLAAFLHEIAEAARKNPYLMTVINAASSQTFPVLFKKVNEPDAPAILTEVVAYTLLQDRLITIFRGDPKLMDETFLHMQNTREIFKMKDKSLFENLKIATMNAVAKAYKDLHDHPETLAAKPDWGRVKLVLNILEATGTDFFAGLKDNAYTGWVLLSYPAGAKKNHPVTHQGAGRWAPVSPGIVANSVVERYPPFPEKWGDLYSTWNLCFCSSYENWPFFFAKLMNPSVFAEYHKPNQEAHYLYNRGLGLVLHIQFEYMRRYDRGGHAGTVPPDPVQWKDDDFTKLWGVQNRAAATAYKSEVEKADPGVAARMEQGWAKFESAAAAAADNAKADFKDFIKSMRQKALHVLDAAQDVAQDVAKVASKSFHDFSRWMTHKLGLDDGGSSSGGGGAPSSSPGAPGVPRTAGGGGSPTSRV